MTWIAEHELLLWGLGVFSLATFVGSLIAIPLVIVRIPEDYFVGDKRRTPSGPQPNLIRHYFAITAKNLLGLLFVLSGVIMLATPGQGLLTILLGIMLMNFPGKYRLERGLVAHPTIWQSINWIRKKAHRRPLRGVNTKTTSRR